MSTYGNFIDETIKTEYDLISVLKNDENSYIELFSHKPTGSKLVKILSKNRNDHIYRKLRGLQHKNLPIIYDICSCEEHLLVLESYIDGETLESILEKNEISEKTAISYLTDLCEALDFLHKNRIIHRDVKPTNVIITPENRAILIDFSAARLVSDVQDKDTSNLGTAGYAAPEQYGIFQSMPPTDIYALGVLFNLMLINTHPSVKIPSGKLGKIIKKCVDTQISKRYQSVDALKKDLNRYKKFHL